MRLIHWVIFFLLVTTCAMGQSYRPRQGETVVYFEVEGKGEVAIRLLTDRAPKTTGHIIDLVKRGFYDGLRFHRIEKTPKPYLVQVGDPASRNGLGDNVGSGGSGTRIPYEDSGSQNVEGAVGLARMPGDRDSGDSQFYILLGTSKFLDGHYTVFGQIAAGMDVVKRVELGDRIARIRVVTG